LSFVPPVVQGRKNFSTLDPGGGIAARRSPPLLIDELIGTFLPTPFWVLCFVAVVTQCKQLPVPFAIIVIVIPTVCKLRKLLKMLDVMKNICSRHLAFALAYLALIVLLCDNALTELSPVAVVVELVNSSVLD
jgi:hypothetical protein